MQGVAVTLLTEDRERLSVLQHRLEGTGMGRNVFSHVGFPDQPHRPGAAPDSGRPDGSRHRRH